MAWNKLPKSRPAKPKLDKFDLEAEAEQLRADSPRLKSSLEACGFEQVRLRVASDERL